VGWAWGWGGDFLFQVFSAHYTGTVTLVSHGTPIFTHMHVQTHALSTHTHTHTHTQVGVINNCKDVIQPSMTLKVRAGLAKMGTSTALRINVSWDQQSNFVLWQYQNQGPSILDSPAMGLKQFKLPDQEGQQKPAVALPLTE